MLLNLVFFNCRAPELNKINEDPIIEVITNENNQWFPVGLSATQNELTNIEQLRGNPFGPNTHHSKIQMDNQDRIVVLYNKFDNVFLQFWNGTGWQGLNNSNENSGISNLSFIWQLIDSQLLLGEEGNSVNVLWHQEGLLCDSETEELCSTQSQCVWYNYTCQGKSFIEGRVLTDSGWVQINEPLYLNQPHQNVQGFKSFRWNGLIYVLVSWEKQVSLFVTNGEAWTEKENFIGENIKNFDFSVSNNILNIAILNSQNIDVYNFDLRNNEKTKITSFFNNDNSELLGLNYVNNEIIFSNINIQNSNLIDLNKLNLETESIEIIIQGDFPEISMSPLTTEYSGSFIKNNNIWFFNFDENNNINITDISESLSFSQSPKFALGNQLICATWTENFEEGVSQVVVKCKES